MSKSDSTYASPNDLAARWTVVRQWLALLVIAAVVRGGVLAIRISSLHADPDGYRMIAEHLVNDGMYGRPDRDDPQGQIYPTAYRPPLYPLLLAPLVVDGQLSIVATAGLHFVLGLATVACVAWFGLRCGLGGRSFVAAILVALDPLLVNQSTLVMTETLAALNAILILIAVERLRAQGSLVAASLAGGAIGLAALCRPTFLPFVTVVAACEFVWPNHPSAWRRRALRAAVVLLAAAVVVSPWAIRNKRQFDRWIATTTHGGYTLLLGNNPGFYSFLRTGKWGEVWEPKSTERLIAGCHEFEAPELPGIVLMHHSRVHGGELTEDRQLNDCAWRAIRHDPWGAVRAATYRVGQLWSPLAHRQSQQESFGALVLRWGAAAWYLMVFGAALMGLHRLGWQASRGPWLAGLLLCLSFTLVHSLYWANLRMRAPLMPFVALLACARPRNAIEDLATEDTKISES